MSYTSSPTLEGRVRDWLKLSAAEQAEYIDPRIELRRQAEARWVAAQFRAVLKTRRGKQC